VTVTAIDTTASSALLVSTAGAVIDLPVDRWRAQPDAVERRLLARLPDPVLDVGCGPGRLVAALAAAGRPALGVDPSAAAVAEARRQGAPVLTRSVFSRLPGEGRWGAVLLLDGNVGIGGDPEALLRRAVGLLRSGGVVVAEVEPPGHITERLTVRVETPRSAGPWFAWARVGIDEFADAAATAGLRVEAAEANDVSGGRWFARAVAP
jgi:SAM-dependent methyltransferase